MAGPASSRTVSASTDSSLSATSAETVSRSTGGRGALSNATAPLVAAGHAASGRVSHFWTTPGWRRAKHLADRALLLAVVAAIAWAAVNGVFTAQRAATNRGIAIVHLSGHPILQVPRTSGGNAAVRPVLPTSVLLGTRTGHFSINIANDGPDGVVLKDSTLTGPYLAGPARLVPDATGYIVAGGAIHLTGTVTVDCDAAAQVAGALTSGWPSPERQATTLAIPVADAGGHVHDLSLVIDTTAFAVQGQVCTA